MSTEPLTVDLIQGVLTEFQDPETGRSIAKQGQIKNIAVDNQSVALKIGLASHSNPLKEVVADDLVQWVKSRCPGAESVSVELVDHERKPQKLGQIGLTVKSVIAVGSGKGGVGKSTVSASLAFALKKAGAKVGLLDADVYGPSVPTLTGASGEIQQVDGKMVPSMSDGMPMMSIGFLIPSDQAVIWRGPMLHSAMGNFLRDTNWGELDYLIIDMPPGTGDVALSLSQMLPLTGAVVVCTPQEVALADAVRAVSMFRQVKIPVLGLVENMSGFVCPGCEKEYDIFGKGGARQYAEKESIPFLGDVPIQIGIRERGDTGKTSASLEDPIVGPRFSKIAFQLVSRLRQMSAENPVQPQLPVL